MYPPSFQFFEPEDLADVFRLMEEHGDDARLLSGGQSLIPMMKLRFATPAILISLARIPDLKGITGGNQIEIGAMTTHWEVQSSTELAASLPFITEVASVIADPQVRNRGTIGGSLANADPSADYPAAILALNGTIVCASREGEREVAATDWFVDLMTTSIEEGELVKKVLIPKPSGRFGAAYRKHHHPASRFAMAGIAAALELDAAGEIIMARIGVTGLGMAATRAVEAETLMIGRVPDRESIEAAAAFVDAGIEVTSGFQMTEADKCQLARSVARTAITEAVARARTAAERMENR